MNDYKVVEEAGLWYVATNGHVSHNEPYFHPKEAKALVERLKNDDRLWAEMFVLERRVAEALQDCGWPYEATCEKHTGLEGPFWVLTEPYRNDEYSTRVVNPDPTGLIPVGIYDRPRYELACSVLGLCTHSDKAIQEKMESTDRFDFGVGENGQNALKAVAIRLAFRRSIGIHIEEMEEKERRTRILDDAGLMLDQYTRDQYETACEIMGALPLPDDRIMLLVTLDVANDAGLHITAPGLPNDPVSISLAYCRAIGISPDKTGEEK